MSVEKKVSNFLTDLSHVLDTNSALSDEGNHIQNEYEFQSWLCRLIKRLNIRYESEYSIVENRPDLGKGDLLVWLSKKKNTSQGVCLTIELKFFNENIRKEHIVERLGKVMKQVEYYTACNKIRYPNNNVTGIILYNIPNTNTLTYENVYKDITIKNAKKILNSDEHISKGKTVMNHNINMNETSKQNDIQSSKSNNNKNNEHYEKVIKRLKNRINELKTEKNNLLLKQENIYFGENLFLRYIKNVFIHDLFTFAIIMIILSIA